MNTDTLALLDKYFDLAITAPDGIKRLRETILSLAMQGKLVPQDPKDPPASELLKQIEAEKKRLVQEGKIKEPKTIPPIKPDEVPYQVPASWEWVRLEQIGEINPRNASADDTNAGFVPMPMIFAEIAKPHTFETRIWGDIKKGFTHFKDGDIGMAKITPCFENGKSCIFNSLPNGIGAGTTELHIYRNTYFAIEPRYLLYFIKNPRYLQNGEKKMTGSAGQKRVPTEYFAREPFPLPPLPEQRRIVAKIDELMARVNELERKREAQNERRIVMHHAAVARLLDAGDAGASRGGRDFIFAHFSDLYNTKENVAELRKAILQLAVMGRLVPQDPKDPPASELLKEIEAEKKRLIQEGTIKEPKPLPPIKPEEVPYQLPESWDWVRLGEICSKITDGEHQTPPRVLEGCLLLSAKNVRNGYLDFTNCDQILKEHYNLARSRCCPEKNDLLIVSVGGTIGRSSLVGDKDDFALVRSVALLKRLLIEPKYFKNALDSTSLQDLIELKKRGGAQPCLYLSEIEQFSFPLPPLPEQHRIVAKVDELMSLCDQLEKKIDERTAKESALLEAVAVRV